MSECNVYNDDCKVVRARDSMHEIEIRDATVQTLHDSVPHSATPTTHTDENAEVHI